MAILKTQQNTLFVYPIEKNAKDGSLEVNYDLDESGNFHAPRELLSAKNIILVFKGTILVLILEKETMHAIENIIHNVI